MQNMAYRQETMELFNTTDGARVVRDSAITIFRLFCEKAVEFNNPRLQWRPDSGFDENQAVAQLAYGSVQIFYRAMNANRVGDLRIRLFNALLPIPGRHQMPIIQEKIIGNILFNPTRTPLLGICWSRGTIENPMTAEQVADFAICELVKLTERLSQERIG